MKYARFLALRLQSRGIGPGDRVPVVVKRGLEMIVGILAVLMCGAQYVPLDGGVVPEKTLRHVLSQAGGSVVLCLRVVKGRIDALGMGKSVIVLEDMLQRAEAVWDDLDNEADVCVGEENSGCYVVYTSGLCHASKSQLRTSAEDFLGTTGTPKGVDVTHGNVTNLVCSTPGNLGMTVGMKVGQVLSISFDMGM
jgi:non-ribosomal peptide synthetase component F